MDSVICGGLDGLIYDIALANPDGLSLRAFVEKTRDAGFSKNEHISAEVREVLMKMCKEGALVRVQDEVTGDRKYLPA